MKIGHVTKHSQKRKEGKGRNGGELVVVEVCGGLSKKGLESETFEWDGKGREERVERRRRKVERGQGASGEEAGGRDWGKRRE